MEVDIKLYCYFPNIYLDRIIIMRLVNKLHNNNCKLKSIFATTMS
jgi:hypothetical protein